jgi:hypothetical protein
MSVRYLTLLLLVLLAQAAFASAAECNGLQTIQTIAIKPLVLPAAPVETKTLPDRLRIQATNVLATARDLISTLQDPTATEEQRTKAANDIASLITELRLGNGALAQRTSVKPGSMTERDLEQAVQSPLQAEGIIKILLTDRANTDFKALTASDPALAQTFLMPGGDAIALARIQGLLARREAFIAQLDIEETTGKPVEKTRQFVKIPDLTPY